LDLNLDPTRIHRFVVGEDQAPLPMTVGDAEATLGDDFATQVLLKGTFPQSGEEAVNAIKAAVEEGHPLRDQMSFVLGEGSQIPPEADPPPLSRGLRFVVTLGATANGPPDGPDVLVSVEDPRQAGVELMAWDKTAGGFNYYRSMGDPPAWVFAGNAHHALADPTQGKGPFESHKSGALLMKELKLPWTNWDSPLAQIFGTAFAGGDDRREHPWFKDKEPGGAYTFENEVARPAIRRWAKARFGPLRAANATVENPLRIMEQILGTPAVDLFSSRRESRSVASGSPVELPTTFFVDADGLAAVGLQAPPEFTVSGSIYAQTLQAFDVKLSDERFVQTGDTHFAFVIPERAFEDQVVLQEALKVGLITPRLAAALLMTDFPNPIFSDRRAALLAHVPPKAAVSGGASSFSQEMADKIVAAASAGPDGSAEQEFAERWNVGENFDGPFNELLSTYFEAVTTRLETQAGFNDYFHLAESRRASVRNRPIFENPLLFATTNLIAAIRQMRPDGSVA